MYEDLSDEELEAEAEHAWASYQEIKTYATELHEEFLKLYDEQVRRGRDAQYK